MNDPQRIHHVRRLSFKEMEEFLTNPLSRVQDSRIIEDLYSWGYELQFLLPDDTILATGDTKEFPALELFKLQYRHNPRNNPRLYGLLDEKR